MFKIYRIINKYLITGFSDSVLNKIIMRRKLVMKSKMRYTLKRAISMLLVFIMIFSVCAPAAQAYNYSGEKTLSPDVTKLEVGESTELKVPFWNFKVKWESSNERVATVSESGEVTGVAAGSVTVIATSKTLWNIFTASVTKHEFKIVVTDRTIPEPGTTEINVGETAVLSTNRDGKTSWTTSDASIVSVSTDGVIKGVSEGNATVTATTKNYLYSFWIFKWGERKYTTDFEVVVKNPEPVPENYTVTFNSNGGSAVESQIVEKGGLAVLPSEPVKSGYMFIGWFETGKTENWTETFLFDTPIYKDIMLNAVWVDITTDTDGDGLYDDMEKYIGTRIGLVDTDGDGISDYDEKIVFDYDPKILDTDGDNVEDGDEDFDNDGLSNIWELEKGTNPILSDSDNDFLSDYHEIFTYKTDPNNKDTDGDDASDGDEIRLGTNPLFFDSDFTEHASLGKLEGNCQIAIEVEANVDGDQVGNLKIAPVTSSSNPVISSTIPGYLGNAYDISVNGQPESAVLTFKYDTSLGKLGEDFQPRVYYCNEETRTLEELPNQEVSEGQVRVAVEHFSTYVFLNKVAFDDVWKSEIKGPNDEGEAIKSLSIAFAVDVSGSMQGSNISTVKEVMNSFIDNLSDEDRAAVIKFESSASIVQKLTDDKNSLKSAVNSLRASGGTTIRNGVKLAIDELIEDKAEGSYDTIILLTDGQDSGFNNYWNEYAQLCVENNIIAYSIGIGSGVSSSHLTKFAESTDGKYYHADVASDLKHYFEEIKSETVDYTTDSNNDGISDYYTNLIATGELPLSNGSKEFKYIDFNYNRNGEISDDYDMDGVKNGDELKVIQSGNRVYMYMVSDPMMEYSDADEYSDYEEHKNGSDPMISSYSKSTIDYPLSDENFTYYNVYKQQDSWYKEGAREIWSTLTFNWSHQDEAKRVLASFFKQYSDLNKIEDTTDAISKEVAELLGNDAIGKLKEMVENGDLAIDTGKTICDAIKCWISAGNSARNLSPDHFVQLKAQLGLFNYRFFKGISSADVKMAGVSFAIEEVTDIYDWVKSYSSIIATQSAFYENIDVLQVIKNNDNAKEKFVTKAAGDIILVANNELNKFQVESVKDLALATAENVGSIALNILSNLNPYTMAINLALGILDAVTPATEIAEAAYCLYVVDELVNANKSLAKLNSMNYNYYNIADDNLRYLELLICARMWGGDFAKTITSSQHYWGLFNDDEIRKKYADYIDGENDKLKDCLAEVA